MVYKPFFPYLMWHWCGTARMIEWGNQEKAYSKVNYWLGHKEFNQTKTYVEFGQLFNDNNGSWMSRALKRGSIGGLHVSPSIAQQVPKKGLVEQSFSEKNQRICRDSNPG